MVDTPVTDTAPPATPPAAPPPAWFAGLDPEIRGHLETKGWDKLPPDQAAAQAVQSYRELEKMRGVPGDLIARLPKDQNDKEAWDALNERLGVPKDKAAYDLTAVKDELLATRLRDVAAAGGLRPDQAQRLASALAEHATDTAARTASEVATKTEAAKARLVANWGPNYDTNLFNAQRGFERLGFSPETIAALEASTGYDVVMEDMRKLAVASGEARYIEGTKDLANAPMSADAAQAQKDHLLGGSDRAWLDRFAKGGSEEVEQLRKLNETIVRARMA